MNNQSKHALYATWVQILRRCSDPRVKNYANYGGRGISVCTRWRADFWSFVADMGARPTPKHSVERINNDGDYEPTNCRWATDAEQKLNTRRSRTITFKGKTLPVTEWARRLGIHPATLFWRLRNGVPVDEALTAPRRRGRVVGAADLEAEMLKVGLTRAAYYTRRKAGMTHEQALKAPRYQRRRTT